jgi:hypothetical protein
MEVTPPGTTASDVDPAIVGISVEVAVTVVEPGATAVASPEGLMVAMPVGGTLHITLLSMCVPVS